MWDVNVMVRNKEENNNNEISFPLTSSFFKFTPSFPAPLPPLHKWHRWMGMEAVIIHKSSSLLLLPPYISLLFQSGCSTGMRTTFFSTGCRGIRTLSPRAPPPPYASLPLPSPAVLWPLLTEEPLTVSTWAPAPPTLETSKSEISLE